MREHKVRRIDRHGTGDIERICNELAAKGWRLVSTGITRARAHGTLTRRSSRT